MARLLFRKKVLVNVKYLPGFVNIFRIWMSINLYPCKDELRKPLIRLQANEQPGAFRRFAVRSPGSLRFRTRIVSDDRDYTWRSWKRTIPACLMQVALLL
jgi:hypothetical protein